MCIEYRTGCRPSSSARKRRHTRFPRARIRYPDNRWMDLAMHTLSFHVFPTRLPPVTLSNPMFACVPFWAPIITHLPGTWGVELIPETKSRAHHIGSTITVLGVNPYGHGSPSTAAVSEIGRGASGAACFRRKNELVACMMGAYFNLVFGRCLPH
jgi:hypothetical protein